MDYEHINKISYKIIGAAIEVHRKMGPGLFESIYEECLMTEFDLRGIRAVRQTEIPLTYKGQDLKQHFFIDILVEQEVIVELKSVKDLHDVHDAQIISYMRLTGKKLGLLINFNVPVLKNGIRRFIDSKRDANADDAEFIT